MKRILSLLKKDAVLTAAWTLAVLSMAAVPPSIRYIGYLDLHTLGLLFCLMVTMAGLQAIGFFHRLGESLLMRIKSLRQLEVLLVLLCFFSSMLITNDVALITFVPFAIELLKMIRREDRLIPVVVLQTIAANLGSMATPIGNPQNLYLFERFDIPLTDFLATMALPFAVSVLLIGLSCALFAKPTPRASEGRPAEGRHLARSDVAPVDRRRAIAFGALLLVVIASVFRLVPYPVSLVAVVAGLLVLDRRALRSVDFGLLLTFVCFFVFAGNMARIPSVEAVLSQAMADNALLASAAASQIVSNVPAAVLLSHFTDSYQALLVGVNIGGAGTLVASLASLITFNQYRAVRAALGRRPELARQTASGFVARFTAFNFAFLAVLYAVCAVCG